MADDLAIYEAIAVAVSEGREPDLSSLEPSQVRTALERVLKFPLPRRDFLAWLNGRVQYASGGRASLQEWWPLEDAPLRGQNAVPELHVRVVMVGEQFAEPAVIRVEDPVLQFPMRPGPVRRTGMTKRPEVPDGQR